MDNVGILLFNDIELLDFAGPFEVFSVTSELNSHQLFNVFTIASDGAPIQSVNGLKVLPDFAFDNHPTVDILVVPGGVGTKTEMLKDNVLNWLQKTVESSKITMSVCSGARLLGVLGLLENLEICTHHEVFAHMRKISPNAIIRDDRRFTDNGKLMTSGGISAGIDLAVHVVEKIHGKQVANKTIKYMEYGDWRLL